MKYETIFVAQPRMTEDDFDTLRQSFEEVIRTQGGTIDRSESWGKRRLAYRVQKHEEAFYGFFLYDGTGPVVKELERRFRLHEGVIKFLSVKAPPEGAKIAGSADLRPRPPEPAAPEGTAAPPPHAPEGAAPIQPAPAAPAPPSPDPGTAAEPGPAVDAGAPAAPETPEVKE